MEGKFCLRAFWSLPEAENLAQAARNWKVLDNRPVYALPRGGTTWELLSALADRHAEEIKALAPQAVVIGSARGEMTMLFQAYDAWRSTKALTPTLSPETSLGTLASRLARRLGIQGPAWTVSQTCLSGLVALYQAALLIRAGAAQRVLFGAVEAPLHPFFVEAMAALRIYSRQNDFPFVRPLSGENTFALGEAVALGVLTEGTDGPFRVEAIHLTTAAPREGLAFPAVDAEALAAFLREFSAPPDMVFLHAPGTRQGDAAEWQAIRLAWGDVPACAPKAFFGHSLGASPLVSLGLACAFLRQRRWVTSLPSSKSPAQWQRAVVLALGYGGVMGAIELSYAPSGTDSAHA
ncbi:MAG: beta-ketoacyl synthase N-terminal-like domain-containing protein [Bacteroidia bacterium]